MQDTLATLPNSDQLLTNALAFGQSLLVALIIFFVGRFLARFCAGLVQNAMIKAQAAPALIGMMTNITRVVLTFVALLVALDSMGFDTTSLLALFAAAGLAVGLALKDSLSNFAAGVMLILFKTFDIDDFIEAAGTAGVVEYIGVFSTRLRTGDNREVTIPNSHIYGGTIVNVSAKPTRRIDMVIGVSYDADLQLTTKLLQEIAAADDRILKDPGTTVAVAELADSSVNFVLRPWVNAADYWAVKFQLLETIKTTFDANGIGIPYPTQDVNVHQKA